MDSPGKSADRRWNAALLPAALIVLCALAAYANTFPAPFLFDDLFAIHRNPTIERLWPPGPVLSPPDDGSGVTGRPLVNLSFAINYALGGLDPVGYHIFNFVCHALSGIVLFGIVRRTLLQPIFRRRFDAGARDIALASALLWTLHPLQTESVTCIIQRTELLMGLFFLLTLYGFIRSAQSPASRYWPAVTFLCCLLGMATKEVMVTAPVLILAYDWIFLAGSVREAWPRRRALHGSLAATWMLLAWLVIRSGSSRGGSAGFGLPVTWERYGLTQFGAVAHYLRLALWPHPLVLDYGTQVAGGISDVALQAALIVSLGVASLVLLWRRQPWGFLGLWFFGILAPSSSIVPLVTQTMAEHRMYLSLAAPMVAIAVLLHRWCGKGTRYAVAALALGFAATAFARNRDYRSTVSIWADTAAKQPGNDRALSNYGEALFDAGSFEAAATQLHASLRIRPTLESEALLGMSLARLDKIDEASVHFGNALRIDPNHFPARLEFGIALLNSGRPREAIAQFSAATALQPDSAEAHFHLASALLATGQPEAGYAEDLAAAKRDPASIRARLELAVSLLQAGAVADALPQLQEAVKLAPNDAGARYDLGAALVQLRRDQDAAEQLEQALRLQPGLAPARELLNRIAPARTK